MTVHVKATLRVISVHINVSVFVPINYNGKWSLYMCKQILLLYIIIAQCHVLKSIMQLGTCFRPAGHRMLQLICI